MLTMENRTRLVRKVGVGEDPEGRAAVLDVGEAGEAFDDRVALVQVHVAVDERLGHLVEGDDGPRDPEIETAPPRQVRHVALAFSHRVAGEDRRATLAHAGVDPQAPDVLRIGPAALAPAAVGADDLHRHRSLGLDERRPR